MHPASIAAQVLRSQAPRQSHEGRRACLTVADHLESAVRSTEANYFDDPSAAFADGIEMDFYERTEVAR
jgi:hypothetical protein